MNTPSYFDLECNANEVNSALRLGVLQKLATELRIQPSDLFADKAIAPSEKISLNELVGRIKQHLKERQISVSQFEENVGYVISDSLENESSVLEWSIECLESVCAEIGVDWRRAL